MTASISNRTIFLTDNHHAFTTCAELPSCDVPYVTYTLSMVQVIFLDRGALGDEDWKLGEETGGEHRGSGTAGIDCALAEPARRAGAPRADDSAHGRRRVEQRGG